MRFIPQTAQNLYVAEVTIAAAASASEVIPTQGLVPVSVFTDATTTDVTTTHLKIQSCLTVAGTFVDAIGSDSATIKAPSTAGRLSTFSGSAYAPFIKLVAVDTNGAIDAQSAERTVKVVMRRP